MAGRDRERHRRGRRRLLPSGGDAPPLAAALLAELQRVGAEHAGNVLAVGARATGVVDWENTTSGDPAYDIAYLWFCIYDHEDCGAARWRHLVGVAEPSTIALYAAHVIIGFVSGSIAHVPEWIDRRPDAAERAIADLAALGIRVSAPYLRARAS